MSELHPFTVHLHNPSDAICFQTCSQCNGAGEV